MVITTHPETAIKLSRPLTGAVSFAARLWTPRPGVSQDKSRISCYLSRQFPDVSWQPRNSRRPHGAQAVLVPSSPPPCPVKPRSCQPLSLYTRRRWSILYTRTGQEAFPLCQEFKSKPPELLFFGLTHLKFCPQPPKSPAMTLSSLQLLCFVPLPPLAHTVQKEPDQTIINLVLLLAEVKNTASNKIPSYMEPSRESPAIKTPECASLLPTVSNC